MNAETHAFSAEEGINWDDPVVRQEFLDEVRCRIKAEATARRYQDGLEEVSVVLLHGSHDLTPEITAALEAVSKALQQDQEEETPMPDPLTEILQRARDTLAETKHRSIKVDGSPHCPSAEHPQCVPVRFCKVLSTIAAIDGILENNPALNMAREELRKMKMRTGCYPMQPIERDGQGTPRFRENPLIRLLLEASPWNLNDVMVSANEKGISNASMEQFWQLIGYSVSGFGDLSFAHPDTVAVADRIAAQLLPEGGDPR